MCVVGFIAGVFFGMGFLVLVNYLEKWRKQ
jgi:hypothetical protein